MDSDNSRDLVERADDLVGATPLAESRDPSRASITKESLTGGPPPLFPEFGIMGVHEHRLRLQTRFDSRANMSSDERRAYADADVHTGDLWAHREVREAIRGMLPGIEDALDPFGLEPAGDPDLSQNPVRGNRLAMKFTVVIPLRGEDGALDSPGAPAEAERALIDRT